MGTPNELFGTRGQAVLSPKTFSSPGLAPSTTDIVTTNGSNLKTSYFLFNFAGLYSSSDRHIDKVIDAIWRAIVSLARFGLVPPSSSC